MIRLVLPAHLQVLANCERVVELDVGGVVSQNSLLDALEQRYPVLRGTIRDTTSRQRRPFIRFFACELDLSHESPDLELPPEVSNGIEPFYVIGAMAGG